MALQIISEKLKKFLFSSPKIIFINFYRLILRKKIFNLKRLPSDRPAILAINHITGADPVIILAAFRKKIIFLADSRCFDTKIADFFFRRFTNSIPVFKKKFYGNLNSFKELFSLFCSPGSSKKAGSVKNKNIFLGIFPEGILNKKTELKEFFKGTAYLSYKMKLPIIPVYISNIFKGPRSKNWFTRRPVLEGLITIACNAFKKIHIFIGNPIDPLAENIIRDLEGMADKENYKHIVEKIHLALKQEFESLKSESDASIGDVENSEDSLNTQH